MDQNGSKRSSLCHESPSTCVSPRSIQGLRPEECSPCSVCSVPCSPMFTMFTMVSLSETVIEGGLVSLVKSCENLTCNYCKHLKTSQKLKPWKILETKIYALTPETDVNSRHFMQGGYQVPAVMHRLSHKETFTKMLQRQQTFAPQVLYKVPTVPTREVEEKVKGEVKGCCFFCCGSDL